MRPAKPTTRNFGFPPLGWHSLIDQRIQKLTLQEIAVLAQLRAGLPDKLIAFELGLSIAAVRFHLKNVRKKIGAKSRLEAALWASVNFWPPTLLVQIMAAVSPT